LFSPASSATAGAVEKQDDSPVRARACEGKRDDEKRDKLMQEIYLNIRRQDQTRAEDVAAKAAARSLALSTTKDVMGKLFGAMAVDGSLQ
jgi:hypothetical protein